MKRLGERKETDENIFKLKIINNKNIIKRKCFVIQVCFHLSSTQSHDNYHVKLLRNLRASFHVNITCLCMPEVWTKGYSFL